LKASLQLCVDNLQSAAFALNKRLTAFLSNVSQLRVLFLIKIYTSAVIGPVLNYSASAVSRAYV
jgi:hypothetical protein